MCPNGALKNAGLLARWPMTSICEPNHPQSHEGGVKLVDYCLFKIFWVDSQVEHDSDDYIICLVNGLICGDVYTELDYEINL